MTRAPWRGLFWLLAGCAGGSPATGPRVSVAELSSERIATLLDHHHLVGGPLEGTRAERMGRHVLLSLGGEECAARAESALRADALQLGAALRRGDTRFVRDAARACGRPVPAAEAASRLLWDAAAQAYDVYSRYLDVEARSRWEATPTQPGEPVRGRSLRVDGRVFAHLQVPSFYARADGHTSSHDAAEVWSRLGDEAPGALVLDLRGNPGGELDEALRLLDWLGYGGPKALALDRAGTRRVLGAPTRPGSRVPAPLVVRIDGATAGEAELVAAVLGQAGVPLVGQRTRGKATVQTTIRLNTPSGLSQGALRLSVEQLYLACGTSWQLRGVEPTHALPTAQDPQPTERELPFALPAQDLRGADCRPAAVDDDSALQAAIALARTL